MHSHRLAAQAIGSSDGSFVLAEWTDGGETSRDFPIAPLHRHLDEDEAWYVLEGALGFRIGDEEVIAEQGGAVVIPRGTPHTYWNAADSVTRYLIVMGPTTHRLIEEIHSAGSLEPESMRALFRKHGSELS